MTTHETPEPHRYQPQRWVGYGAARLGLLFAQDPRDNAATVRHPGAEVQERGRTDDAARAGEASP